MLTSASALKRVIHSLLVTLPLFGLVLAQSSSETSVRMVISNTMSGPIASDSLATSPISEPTTTATSATTDEASTSTATVTQSSTLCTVLYIASAALVLLVLAGTTSILLFYRRRRNRVLKEAPANEKLNQLDLPPPSPNAMFDLEDPYRRMGPPSPGPAELSMSQARNSYLSPASAWDSDATLTPAQASAFLKAREKEKDLGADFDESPVLAPHGGIIIDQSNMHATPMLLPKMDDHHPDDDISIYAISHEGSTLGVNEPHAR